MMLKYKKMRNKNHINNLNFILFLLLVQSFASLSLIRPQRVNAMKMPSILTNWIQQSNDNKQQQQLQQQQQQQLKAHSNLANRESSFELHLKKLHSNSGKQHENAKVSSSFWGPFNSMSDTVKRPFHTFSSIPKSLLQRFKPTSRPFLKLTGDTSKLLRVSMPTASPTTQLDHSFQMPIARPAGLWSSVEQEEFVAPSFRQQKSMPSSGWLMNDNNNNGQQEDPSNKKHALGYGENDDFIMMLDDSLAQSVEQPSLSSDIGTNIIAGKPEPLIQDNNNSNHQFTNNSSSNSLKFGNTSTSESQNSIVQPAEIEPSNGTIRSVENDQGSMIASNNIISNSTTTTTTLTNTPNGDLKLSAEQLDSAASSQLSGSTDSTNVDDLDQLNAGDQSQNMAQFQLYNEPESDLSNNNNEKKKNSQKNQKSNHFDHNYQHQNLQHSSPLAQFQSESFNVIPNINKNSNANEEDQTNFIFSSDSNNNNNNNINNNNININNIDGYDNNLENLKGFGNIEHLTSSPAISMPQIDSSDYTFNFLNAQTSNWPTLDTLNSGNGDTNTNTNTNTNDNDRQQASMIPTIQQSPSRVPFDLSASNNLNIASSSSSLDQNEASQKLRPSSSPSMNPFSSVSSRLIQQANNLFRLPFTRSFHQHLRSSNPFHVQSLNSAGSNGNNNNNNNNQHQQMMLTMKGFKVAGGQELDGQQQQSYLATTNYFDHRRPPAKSPLTDQIKSVSGSNHWHEASTFRQPFVVGQQHSNLEQMDSSLVSVIDHGHPFGSQSSRVNRYRFNGHQRLNQPLVGLHTKPMDAGQSPMHYPSLQQQQQQPVQLMSIHPNRERNIVSFRGKQENAEEEQGIVQQASSELSETLSQNQKRFRSGLYQIEAPRLTPSEMTDLNSEPQVGLEQQLSVEHATRDSESHSPSTSERPFRVDDSKQATIIELADEQEQPTQSQTSKTEDQKRPNEGGPKGASNSEDNASTFSAQVGATIGFKPNQSNNTRDIVRGKVFDERPDEGQKLNQMKSIKHSEEITLYEFEEPSEDSKSSGDEDRQQQQQLMILAQHGNHPSPGKQQSSQMLDTQVYTMPYYMSMQNEAGEPVIKFRPANEGHGRPYLPPPPPPQFRPQNEPIQMHSNPNVNHYRGKHHPNNWLSDFRAPRPFQLQFNRGPMIPQNQKPLQPHQTNQHDQFIYHQSEPKHNMGSQVQQGPIRHHQHFNQFPTRHQPIMVQPFRHLAPQLFGQHPQPMRPFQLIPFRGDAFESNKFDQAPVDVRPEQPRFLIELLNNKNQNGQILVQTNNSQIVNNKNLTEQEKENKNQSSPVIVESEDASISLVSKNDNNFTTTTTTNSKIELGTKSISTEANDRQVPLAPAVFCANKSPGLYADMTQRCKSYYHCAPTGHQIFHCNNQTQFNQNTQNCDWWYNVKCPGSTMSVDNVNQNETQNKTISNNDEIYQNFSNDQNTTSTSTSNIEPTTRSSFQQQDEPPSSSTMSSLYLDQETGSAINKLTESSFSVPEAQAQLSDNNDNNRQQSQSSQGVDSAATTSNSDEAEISTSASTEPSFDNISQTSTTTLRSDSNPLEASTPNSDQLTSTQQTSQSESISTTQSYDSITNPSVGFNETNTDLSNSQNAPSSSTDSDYDQLRKFTNDDSTQKAARSVVEVFVSAGEPSDSAFEQLELNPFAPTMPAVTKALTNQAKEVERDDVERRFGDRLANGKRKQQQPIRVV